MGFSVLALLLLVALWWMTRRAQAVDHPKENALLATAAQAIGPQAQLANDSADLTGDEKPEYVFTKPAGSNPKWVNAFAVVWLPKKKPMVVLAVSDKGIVGKDNAVLLAKPDAAHGYLYSLDAQTHQVNVCPADANGAPAGDWVAFVWDEGRKSFAVANP